MRSAPRDDLTAARRRRSQVPLAGVGLLAGVVAVGVLHVGLVQAPSPHRAAAAAHRRLAAVEARATALVSRLQAEADAVASLPDATAALSGDRAATGRLFRALEARRRGSGNGVALAVHRRPEAATVAWSGRAQDPAGLAGLVGAGRDVFVIGGAVTTTLVAVAPAAGGEGFVTATTPLAVRRNVHNEFLADHDVLAAGLAGLDFRYVDARAQQEGPRPFDTLPPGAVFRDAILRAPDEGVLAAVRAVAPAPERERQRLVTRYRSAAAVVAAVTLLGWAWAGGGRPRATWPLRVVAVAGARALLLFTGPAFPLLAPDLVSPDAYASPLLGPLLRSPLDLLLTATAAAVLAFFALRGALRAPPPAPSRARTAAAVLLAALPVAAALAIVADTVANTAMDLTATPPWPRQPAHLAVQAALALLLGAALMASVALLARAAALPSARRLAARIEGGDSTRLALVVLLGAALVSTLLHPVVAALTRKAVRGQVALSYAPLVLQQPEWRAFVLQAARDRIDAMSLLEEPPPGIYYPDVEELAFAIWSATDLAAYGFSSAVEVQDPTGAVISRFALNLPFLSAPAGALPEGPQWTVTRERLGLASSDTTVRHAQRLLRYHGEPHGAVHVYVAEDFSSLPFVQWRDPYAVLYRSAARSGAPDRPVTLVVWDVGGEVAFSSLERPPALDPRLAAAAAEGGEEGRWTTLEAGDDTLEAYLFADAAHVYALAFERATWGRRVVDLVLAVSGLTVLAALFLVAVLVTRSFLRRKTWTLGALRSAVARRFALRLFVAFTLVAFLPAAVLQLVVSRFVAGQLQREAEDQALDRAGVARKAVEDYAFFQRGEAPAAAPVTDAALVWLASVVKNDLDVFVHGRLQASSKRELYASGLLAPRLSGTVYRQVVLEGQPAVVETESIGGFSYLVASVPVHLGAVERSVLSMPLALRQREVRATLHDLDRAIRLASVLFVALAAFLAQSMSRRISEPIRDLTRATRRVAEGDLEARVVARSRDELRTLVESFNQMAQDLRRQRTDLVRSNRLAAWAEMARQVAHDVKNPLTPIQLSTEHLRRVWADRTGDFGSTLETCTATILTQVRTLRAMVTEFSAFARPPAPVLDRLDLRDVVEEVTSPYRAALPPGLEIHLATEEAPPVRADRRLLGRALVNLLENALQALGDEGRITVSVRRGASPGRAEVEVADDGPGIPPDVRQRIFEPFFSTKTSGSGLGLALVKQIVEDHEGVVTLDSGPGGTRVVLSLPAAE